jgi:tight adherence protein B
MNEIVIVSSFVAVAVGAMAIISCAYDRLWGYRRIVRTRIGAVHRNAPQIDSGELFAMDAESDRQDFIRRSVNRLRHSLELAVPNLTLFKFAKITISLAIVGALVAYLVSGFWLAIPVGFLLGAITPLLCLRILIRNKIQKLTKQLPAAFDVLKSSVQAGHSIQTALQVIADEFEAPISTEFARCVGHAKLGVSPETIYRELASRFPVKEMRILMVGLIIQNRSGGNLSGLLNALAETVRARIRLNGKLKTLTSEGRIQAKAMTLLPLIALAVIQSTSAEYIAPLWRNYHILIFAFVLQVCGALWINRIISACNFQSKGA